MTATSTIQTAARTLAAAFHEDPLFRHVMPDAERRRRSLPRLFEGTARRCRALGGLETVADAAGVAGWVPGSRLSMRLADVIRFGMLTLPMTIGLPAMRRLTNHEMEADQLVEEHLRSEDAYLWVLAVNPAKHGHGLGRQAMDAARDAARATGAHRLVLKTENPDNVSLYEHLGFELLDQADIDASGLTASVLAHSL